MHPKQILTEYNLEPKKSLGQNFLFDENILAQIVDWANLTAQDQVLEIGPGLGSLTSELAKHARRVVAIELDDRFLPILRGELAGFDNVEIRHGDIGHLEHSLEQGMAQARHAINHHERPPDERGLHGGGPGRHHGGVRRRQGH